MKIEPDISGCSIVLLGDFNPAIFQPAWLVAQDIDPPAKDAEISIIHGNITQFSVETRNYRVEVDRFTLETTSGPWVNILDIVSQIFGSFLMHTPVRGFGINRDVHFRLRSSEDRMRLGRRLAPIGPWGEFGNQLNAENHAQTGGLQRLVMRRKGRIDGVRVDTNAIVEPSVRLTGTSGVYMQVNSHHELTDLPDGHGSIKAMKLLEARFESAINEANTIVNQIMEEGLRQ